MLTIKTIQTENHICQIKYWT